MEYSTILKNARDIDYKKRIVSFYFADFNSVDAHGRRMNKNAFNRTFNNNFKRMHHLFNHDLNTIIGKPIEVGKDEKGAFMVSQILNTDKGKEIITLYEEGVLNEHSFGFVIKDSNMEGDVEVVSEVQMYEASSVTLGANENTPVISLNNLEAKMLLMEAAYKDIESINNKIDAIMARLPADEQHQASQTSTQLNDVLTFLNENY